ncbi:hypothetical protein OIU76_023305, partial [Salix suchowensis]
MELNGLKKVRRTDHSDQTNGDLALTSVGDVDPWTAWAYRPRTISLLLIGACFL